MSSSSRSRALTLTALVVTTTLVVGFGVRRARSDVESAIVDARPARRAPAAMPTAIRRPVWRAVAGDSLAFATDFTRLGDTLVVLDGRTHRVHLLRLAGDRWQIVGGWGRRGGGPGEFQRPAALAAVGGDTIAVLEQGGRLQRFTVAGQLVGVEPAPLPCTMALPTIAYGADGARWVAGACAGTGASRDTVFTFLFRAAPGGEYGEVARLPRMALDLSWGTAFATVHPLMDGGRGTALFGTGLDDCVRHLAVVPAHEPAATTRCQLTREQLTAPARPELELERRRAEAQGNRLLVRALRWSESLPSWWGVLADDGPDAAALVLARPWRPDSLALIPAGVAFAPEHVRLVAPIGGFVACVRGGCLWLERESGRLALHDASGADAAGRRAP